MSEKRYSLVYYADKGGAFIKNNENGIEWYHDSRASLLEIVNELNELAEENQLLKDKYERKDRQLQRAKKDVRKYTDYFMNELNWDCDRIIKEVFR